MRKLTAESAKVRGGRSSALGPSPAHVRNPLPAIQLTPAAIRSFRRHVYSHPARRLPWRATCDPYRIFISELMLQQTQVDRVIPKYEAFIRALPSFESCARAPLEKLLRLWQGLGYNRRALALKRAAQVITGQYGGALPADPERLVLLPGIGPATARSIAAFAFDAPVAFLETNIRAVFIHHFFAGREQVADPEILSLVEQTLDRTHPCKWYSALMDYGAMLKKRYRNPCRRSARHRRQSRFEGSRRQIRGKIMRALLNGALTEAQLLTAAGADRLLVRDLGKELARDGLVARRGRRYCIA